MSTEVNQIQVKIIVNGKEYATRIIAVYDSKLAYFGAGFLKAEVEDALERTYDAIDELSIDKEFEV